MLVLILQSALLVAIAYILGCILGCLLRTLTGSGEAEISPATAVVGGGAVAATAAAVSKPAIPPAPAPPAPSKPVKAPEPIKPAEPVAFSPPPKKAVMPSPVVAPRKPKAPAKTAAAVTPAAKEVPAKKAREKAATGPIKAGTKVDNLKLIKGIGPQNEARLNAFGVAFFKQIAEWKRADVDEWGSRLAFPGRIEREEWVSQAKVLAKGGSTDFAKRVERGGVASSIGTATIGDLGAKPKGLLQEARAGGPDKLTLLDGVGASLEKRLFGIGLFHFDQIAKLSESEAKWVGYAVGFPGRVERENWIGNAKTLAEKRSD
ncbi:MAG: hypothetical protein AAGI92_07120 [Pseudomonadota bacterium]